MYTCNTQISKSKSSGRSSCKGNPTHEHLATRCGGNSKKPKTESELRFKQYARKQRRQWPAMWHAPKLSEARALLAMRPQALPRSEGSGWPQRGTPRHPCRSTSADRCTAEGPPPTRFGASVLRLRAMPSKALHNQDVGGLYSKLEMQVPTLTGPLQPRKYSTAEGGRTINRQPLGCVLIRGPGHGWSRLTTAPFETRHCPTLHSLPTQHSVGQMARAVASLSAEKAR